MDAVGSNGSDAEGDRGSINRDSVELEAPSDDTPLPPVDQTSNEHQVEEQVEWEPVTTADGRTYYYNPVTRETRWTRPSS